MEEESRIGFVATYDSIPFEAEFENFDASIRFDPDNPGSASFVIRIDISSVNSNSADRDDGMKQEEWFAVDQYPEARFETENIRRLSGNRFEAAGELSLKDVTRPVEIPFTWEEREDGAILSVESRLRRGDFHIGSGEWAEDDIIGFDVNVRARLLLAPD